MFPIKSINLFILLICGLCFFTAACHKSSDDNNYPYGQITPKGAKPSWGPTITAQMQTVIEELDSLAPTPIYLLAPQQARLQPSAADAVKKVMQNYGIAAPAMNCDTTGKDIPVQGGTIPSAHLYAQDRERKIFGGCLLPWWRMGDRNHRYL